MGAALLSEDQIKAIRSDTRRLPPIAEQYGVSISTISLIRRGKSWRHVA